MPAWTLESVTGICDTVGVWRPACALVIGTTDNHLFFLPVIREMALSVEGDQLHKFLRDASFFSNYHNLGKQSFLWTWQFVLQKLNVLASSQLLVSTWTKMGCICLGGFLQLFGSWSHHWTCHLFLLRADCDMISLQAFSYVFAHSKLLSQCEMSLFLPSFLHFHVHVWML